MDCHLHTNVRICIFALPEKIKSVVQHQEFFSGSAKMHIGIDSICIYLNITATKMLKKIKADIQHQELKGLWYFFIYYKFRRHFMNRIDGEPIDGEHLYEPSVGQNFECD
jgi:hypothetical protein